MALLRTANIFYGPKTLAYLYDGRGSVAQAITVPRKARACYHVQAVSFHQTAFGEQMDKAVKVSGFTYNAEQYDAATGMLNLRARQYEPAMNRFSQKDKLRGSASTPLSLNRYAYVQNDPINLIDPSGMRLADMQVNGEYYSEDEFHQKVDNLRSAASAALKAGNQQEADKLASRAMSFMESGYDYLTPAQKQAYSKAQSQLATASDPEERKRIIREACMSPQEYEKLKKSDMPSVPGLGTVLIGSEQLSSLNPPWDFGYRYISEGEYQFILKNGYIPNTNAQGDPKIVYTSPNKYNTAGEAEAALMIGSKDPNGPFSSPSYRARFRYDNIGKVTTIRQVEGGKGIEVLSQDRIPVNVKDIRSLDQTPYRFAVVDDQDEIHDNSNQPGGGEKNYTMDDAGSYFSEDEFGQRRPSDSDHFYSSIWQSREGGILYMPVIGYAPTIPVPSWGFGYVPVFP